MSGDGLTTHKPTGVMCAVCNLAGFPREIVGYRQGRVPYMMVKWDVMGDARKRVPVCETCADWRETVDPDDQTFDTFTAEHEPKQDPVRFALSVITDSYLLLAIRNRDTSPIARAMPGSSWSEKDTAMRDEAKRRNLL